MDPYYPHCHPEGASKQLTFTEFFDNAPQRFYSARTRLNASSSVPPLLRPFPGDDSGLGFLYLEPPPPLSCPLPPPPYGWCSGLRDFCKHRTPTRPDRSMSMTLSTCQHGLIREASVWILVQFSSDFIYLLTTSENFSNYNRWARPVLSSATSVPLYRQL